VSFHAAMLDLTCLMQLTNLDRPELKDAPWPPVTAGRIAAAEDADRSIFSVIRDRPLMVHHPYEGFSSSVESFIAQAADDPKVQSIKMTLYRAGGDSPIARSLIRAADGSAGRRARRAEGSFRRSTNVTWAKALERAGVHVVYGLVGLKTHAKCVLIVATTTTDSGGTATSARATTTRDRADLRRRRLRHGDPTSARRHAAVQPPHRLQPHAPLPQPPRRAARDAPPARRPHRARVELRPDGHIIVKVNSLVDTTLIESLYAASNAGVAVDLIVRGICCLVPGVPG
jgi:polyphosphate kinase